jgi:serine/threonine-protein phosphatase 4 regulatory subunit 1
MPDLIVLYDAALTREYLWPILKTLLTDSVSIVREDAGWSIPVLLRKYARAIREHDANLFTKEVIEWLKETHLDDVSDNSLVRKSSRRSKKQMVASEGAYSKRQGYCRILAAVALVMRIDENSNKYGNVGFPDESRKKGASCVSIDPFGPLGPSERERFRSIVVNDLLPSALEMTVDCVANVRLTLTKCLKMLPMDIRKESHVEEVLHTLEEELMTWDVPDSLPLNDAASVMGGIAADPPTTQRMVDGVVMTATMSAC